VQAVLLREARAGTLGTPVRGLYNEWSLNSRATVQIGQCKGAALRPLQAVSFFSRCIEILVSGTRAPGACGSLSLQAAKALNAATGLCCLLLVCDGKFQVAQGTSGFADLEPGTAFYAAVTLQLGDPAAVSGARGGGRAAPRDRNAAEIK
jgi:hypothetical protein